MTGTIDQAAPHREGTDTERWVRFTRYAALTVTLWSIALQLSAQVFIPPVTFYGVLFGALGWFLTGERRRLALVVAVLALIALLANLPGTIDELSHPDSAPAFILTTVVTMAALLATVGGVSAFRGWTAEPAKGLAIGAGSLFVAGVLVSVVLASSVDSIDPLADDYQVIAQGVTFDQEQMFVPAGTSGFWIDNQDGVRHTFTVEGLGLEIDVPAFTSQRADFDLATGQYVVICAVPGHENMRIDLTVEG